MKDIIEDFDRILKEIKSLSNQRDQAKTQTSIQTLDDSLEKKRSQLNRLTEELKEGTVQQMSRLVGLHMDELERLATSEELAKTYQFPEAAGIVLREVEGVFGGRSEEEIWAIRKQDGVLKEFFCKGIASNNDARACAYMAVGKEGVEKLRNGEMPLHYSSHHIIPLTMREVFSGEGKEVPLSLFVNDARNMSIIKSVGAKGKRYAGDSHDFLEAVILFPQRQGDPNIRKKFFLPQPAYLFYPPTQMQCSSLETIRKYLEKCEPGITKKISPKWKDVWGRRILNFSKAVGKGGYKVPKEFHDLMNLFRKSFTAETNQERRNMEEALKIAAFEKAKRYLPDGARVGGKILPSDHKSKCPLPVVPYDTQLIERINKSGFPAAHVNALVRIANIERNR